MKRELPIAAGCVILGAALLLKSLRRKRAIDFRDRVALITGGSRGLGLLLARELGRLGARVAIAARDEQELARAKSDLEARGVAVVTIATDLGTPEEAQRTVEACIDTFGRLDILVNNAGIITVGPFDHVSTEDFQEAMSVHFWAPVNTLQAALPYMRLNGGGRIVNISSIGGKIGVPHLSAYCASKFALTGFSESVRPELARETIMITTVCPGLMRTGSIFNAWFKGRHREEFAWFAIAGSIPFFTVSAESAAAKIVDAARHGDPELVISWPAKLAAAAAGVTPGLTATMTGIANRFLPEPTDDTEGEQSHSGWQSSSDWAPSTLTRLSERAAARNNELP